MDALWQPVSKLLETSGLDTFVNVDAVKEIAPLVLLLLIGWATGRGIAWLLPPDPTLIPGVPLIGNVVALGRLGVAFLNEARKKYGDVFTISLAGVKMTFVHDPALIAAFFQAPDSDITFRPAVQQFTQRVFGLPSAEFFPKHSDILRDLRHMLVPSELEVHAIKLADKVAGLMDEALPSAPEGGEKSKHEVELFGAVKSLVFKSAVEVLFGPQLAAGVPGGAQQLQDTFFVFEEAFELAASPFPHLFQKGFTSSRRDLLSWLGQAYRSPGFETDTPAGRLVAKSGVRRELAPNLLLAILWASQANTIPATFWSLAFLVLPGKNQRWTEDILSELRKATEQEASEQAAAAAAAAGAKGKKEDQKDPQAAAVAAAVSRAAFKLSTDRKSTVSRCVAEAIRLRVHSIDLRMAARDLELPRGRPISGATGEGGHRGDAGAAEGTGDGGGGDSSSSSSGGGKFTLKIPKGRILAVCPMVSHHSEEMYGEDPWAFNPDRKPIACLGDGTAVPPSVAGLAFGGGHYRCPGRFFAEMEVATIVQLVLASQQLTLLTATTTEPKRVGGKLGSKQSSGPAPEAAPGPGSPADEAPRTSLLEDLSPFLQQLLGPEAAGFGLGLFPGAAGAAAAEGGRRGEEGEGGGLETWRRSGGDERGLLPPCNLIRLVGLKVPREPCLVKVTGRGEKAPLLGKV